MEYRPLINQKKEHFKNRIQNFVLSTCPDLVPIDNTTLISITYPDARETTEGTTAYPSGNS